MSIRGGKGRNRRGNADTLRSDQGYAVSIYKRKIYCGNPRCIKCMSGPSHGPYLYERFRDEDGKIHTIYKGRA